MRLSFLLRNTAETKIRSWAVRCILASCCTAIPVTVRLKKGGNGGGKCTVNELNNVSNRHCFVIFYCLIVKTTDINLVESLLMHSLQSLTSRVPHMCNYNVKQEENCGQSTCDKAVTSIKSPMNQKGKNEYIYPFVIPQVESNREQRATLLPLRNANISCLDSVFPTITWFLQQPEPLYFHWSLYSKKSHKIPVSEALGILNK